MDSKLVQHQHPTACRKHVLAWLSCVYKQNTGTQDHQDAVLAQLAVLRLHTEQEINNELVAHLIQQTC